MNHITADEAVLSVLSQASGVTQVRNGAGHIAGYYIPFCRDRAHRYIHAFEQIDADDDEEQSKALWEGGLDEDKLKSLMASNGKKGVTLAGVYERLLWITPEPEWRDFLKIQIDRLKEEGRCDTP